jgi:hypothetical protein
MRPPANFYFPSPLIAGAAEALRVRFDTKSPNCAISPYLFFRALYSPPGRDEN